MRAVHLHRVLALMVVTAIATSAPTAVFGAAASGADPDASHVPAAPPFPGFATPEEAARGYMDGVSAADFPGILDTVAIDEVSEGFRFDLQAERLKAFMPISLAPADYPLYTDTNRAMRTEQVALQVRSLAYSLLSDVAIDGSVVAPIDQAWAQGFTEDVDPSRLASLTVVDVRTPDPELVQGERYLQNAAAQAAVYGADELTERVALFYFEGKLFYVGFTLVRYGDEWKVFDQRSPMAGMDAMGTAIPTTLEGFDDLTSSDPA